MIATPPPSNAPIPRVTFDTLDPRAQQYLKPIVERVGYFGEFFAVLGPLPDALLGFMEYTKAVKAPLSERYNEVLALTVCSRLGADYERVQHERLCDRNGLPREWVRALVARGASSLGLLTTDDQALVELAEATLADAASGRSRAALAQVRERLGDAAALAAVLQIARFQMIATLVHAFDLRLPVRSAFDSD